MSWQETASKGCRSIKGYFSRKTKEENTSLPSQSNHDGSAGSRRMAEEEMDLVPRKRSRSSVSRNDVPMNIRDRLSPRRNISNAQTSTMSAEPGVLTGDREQVRQCQPPTGSARAAVLQDVTNMGTDTRPIIPKEPGMLSFAMVFVCIIAGDGICFMVLCRYCYYYQRSLWQSRAFCGSASTRVGSRAWSYWLYR